MGTSCEQASELEIEKVLRHVKSVANQKQYNEITKLLADVVSPGFTETQMLKANMGPDALRELVALTPLARLGQPDDIAEAIAFLVSHSARWITRQNLAVDGGIISR